jgi:hypothetical protein
MVRRHGSPRYRRALVLIYLAGVALDFAWHLHVYLTTGDREIEAFEWVSAVQASLFWPLDLAAQLILALR